VVFSSTLAEATWANSRIVRDDLPGEVKRLREQNGGDIIALASSSVIRTLLKADLIDRLGITLCPEIAGGGATIFHDGLPQSGWSRTGATPTESGALCLLYDRSERSQQP
jgi:dihydrofolate reductase